MKIDAIAHRGYPSKYPENTLSSYKAALDLEFQRIELDTHLSKNGVPVVIHDEKVDRMTYGHGRVKEYTVEDLKKLRVGEDETIPTLDEALKFLKGQVTVLIELKQKGNLYPGIEEKVLEVIQQNDMLDQVIMISFDHYSLARMRRLSGNIEIGLILSGATPAIFPFMKEINANYVSVNMDYITNEFVQACTKNEVNLIGGRVNTEEKRKRMIQRYPSVICSTDNLEDFKIVYEQNA